MDLKGIIAKHAEPVAVKYGTTWEDIISELMMRKQEAFYTEPLKKTLSEVYDMSVLTGPEVLKQLYGFRRVPSREDVKVIPVRPKKYKTNIY